MFMIENLTKAFQTLKTFFIITIVRLMSIVFLQCNNAVDHKQNNGYQNHSNVSNFPVNNLLHHSYLVIITSSTFQLSESQGASSSPRRAGFDSRGLILRHFITSLWPLTSLERHVNPLVQGINGRKHLKVLTSPLH